MMKSGCSLANITEDSQDFIRTQPLVCHQTLVQQLQNVDWKGLIYVLLRIHTFIVNS